MASWDSRSSVDSDISSNMTVRSFGDLEAMPSTSFWKSSNLRAFTQIDMDPSLGLYTSIETDFPSALYSLGHHCEAAKKDAFD